MKLSYDADIQYVIVLTDGHRYVRRSAKGRDRLYQQLESQGRLHLIYERYTMKRIGEPFRPLPHGFKLAPVPASVAKPIPNTIKRGVWAAKYKQKR